MRLRLVLVLTLAVKEGGAGAFLSEPQQNAVKQEQITRSQGAPFD